MHSCERSCFARELSAFAGLAESTKLTLFHAECQLNCVVCLALQPAMTSAQWPRSTHENTCLPSALHAANIQVVQGLFK